MCGLRDDGPSAARFRDEHGGSGHGPRRKSGGTFPPTRPGTPTQTFRYGLVEGGLPVSFVESASHGQYRCHAHRDYSVVARSYVDGLGRARASLLRSEASNSMGGRRWVKSGIALLTARGTPYRAFDPVYVMTDPPAPFDAVGVPSTPFVRAEYDAFGQVWQSIERDNSPSRVFYKALETVAADALDLGVAGTQNAIGQPSGLAVFQNTFTRSRVDGHGRAIEQVLHQRDPATMEDSYERLATTYRTDGAVLAVTRAETTGPALGTPIRDGRSLTRSFTYDTLGRRLGGTDPDSDGRSGSEATQRWRYLYNRVGDLVAMRDPRGCGQNFYYDRAGRLLAEDYVACAEAQLAGESPDETLPSEAIALGLDTAASSRLVDVRYHFDVDPLWDGFTRPASLDRGRLVGSSDRGQRSLVAYDNRGRTTWSARQMAVIPAAGAAPTTRSGNDPGVYVDDDPSSTDTRVFDVAHTYSTTASYDRIDRSIGRVWPTDPDWALFDGTGSAPVVSASMAFNIRGLPANANLSITASGTTTAIPVLRSVGYDVYGQAANSYFGFQHYGVRRQDTYDVRRRPNRIVLLRTATAGAPPTSFGAVAQILNDYYYWDAANNLVEVRDNRLVGPWPEEQRPQRYRIKHDALYRVASVDYTYRNAANSWTTVGNPATDWRDTQNARVDVDPMRRRPAPRLGDLPDSRVINLTYRYDWLANQTEWTDDSQAFYERSLGSTIRNGYTEGQPNGGALRPTALYLAAQLPESPSSPIDPAIDRGGWVRVRYGESGNATSVTVRARCHDVSAATACWDDAGEQDVDQRAAQLLSTCRCDQEQHYEYRWDELNRLAEARRYDRAGSGDWALQVRQRYRYDAGNIRTLKETVDGQTADPSGNAVGGVERVALYVMPGDFERRGLVTNRITDTYDASLALGTETQYLVAGARVVWKPGAVGGGGTGFDRDARVTLAMTNLLQSTAGVVDLVSGELLEVATYYPNGARETLRANSDVEEFALEPVGFTGKEDDSEVGLVYFGMRYLMPHLGRWASPDPLQIHAGGGGEFGNSYHYVSGNLLQARDPLGLSMRQVQDNDGQDNDVFRADYEDRNGNTVDLGTCRGRATDCHDRFKQMARADGELRALQDFAAVVDANSPNEALRAADDWLAESAKNYVRLVFESDTITAAYEQGMYSEYSAVRDILSMFWGASATLVELIRQSVRAGTRAARTEARRQVRREYANQGEEFIDDGVRSPREPAVPLPEEPRDVYIPRDEHGNPIPLAQHRVHGTEIPLPHPAAEGRPHTVLGGRVGSDGVEYRQSATFPEGPTWPQANGHDVPWSRVDWHNHGRRDHANPHQHPFRVDTNQGRWLEGERIPFYLER